MIDETEDNERTADTSDMATRHEGLFLKAALTERKPEGPLPCGRCFNCNEPVAAGVRWCDADCREDWELRENQTRARE